MLNPGPNSLKICYQNVQGLIPIKDLTLKQPSLNVTKMGGGGASILMYTHYMKKPKYTYTLIYINIHKLSFYSALSVNHIMHLNDVFEELLHCINSFDGRFVDI